MKNILIIMMSLLLLNSCKKDDDLIPTTGSKYKHLFVATSGTGTYRDSLFVTRNGTTSFVTFLTIDSCNSGDFYTYKVKADITIPDMVSYLYIDSTLISEYHCYGCKENTITYLVP